MSMRSVLTSVGVAGLILATGIVAAGSPRGSMALADAGPATPTPSVTFEEAQMSDLQTRVAELATQVATLGGADSESVLGRLGGSRTGFDAVYGAPVAYLAASQVQYDLQGGGRANVTFTDGVATTITVIPPRPADRPIDQQDPADWTPAAAARIAADFAPSDADLAPLAAAGMSATGTFSSASAALQGAGAPKEPGSCGPVGPRGFTIEWVSPDADHISALTLAAGDRDQAAAAPKAERAGRSTRGASAVANSSLGGVVSVNGLKLQAVDVNEGQMQTASDGTGMRTLSLELSVENQTKRPIRFDPSDFVLVDADGYELIAGCAGPEPSIASAEVGRGESVHGWVTFLVPEGFAAQRVVILTANARVGFTLR